MSAHTLRWRGGWARIGRWRSRPDVAHLVLGTASPPARAVIDRCVGMVQAEGYQAVVTGALSPADSLAFVDAGFTVRERLHLLAHDLEHLPRAAGPTRRARRDDHRAVLALDASAFDRDWQLDHDGLADALRATPVTRFRVIRGGTGRVSGYALTGRAGRHGYLQRLAVHPAARRRGLGHMLVADALRWLRRRRAERALVNTQLDNTAALGLYESCGFRRLPVGLCVLGRTL